MSEETEVRVKPAGDGAWRAGGAPEPAGAPGRLTGTGAAARPLVVVIGGGLAGAAFVLHLLRDQRPDADITLVEPAATLGAGLAYSTTDPVHRVNVAASRMSLFSEQPGHFDDWLRSARMPSSDPAGTLADGRLYPRRALFGRYVDETLHEAMTGAAATTRHLRTVAVSAAPAPGGGFTVTLADNAGEAGATLAADVLVLAVSHTAPDLPAVLQPLAGDARLVADPWRTGALEAVPRDGRVLVIGTGLTGCDVIASLRARGTGQPITAVSRRGLLPRPRTSKEVAAFGNFAEPPAHDALTLLRRIRGAVAAAAAAGRPWEDIVDALRGQARAVWGALPIAERRRVLRHLRPFWDAHRFQSAPQIDEVVGLALADGGLEVLAATPLEIAPRDHAAGGMLRVTLHPRGTPADQRTTRDVAAVVNCTGPGHRSVVARHPVLRALHEAGALEADAVQLGIAVDAESRVLRPGGAAWPTLFVVGPLARGTHGELMGMPQVSTQPREVAASVAALIRPVSGAATPRR